jgi:peptidoglycan/LPS O-acetylase OafA/YrhL
MWLVARRSARPWWQIEALALGAFGVAGLACVAAASHFQLPLPRLEYTFPTMTQAFALGMGLAVATVALQGREQSSRVVRVLAAHPGLSWALAAGAFAIAIYPLDIRVHHASTAVLVANRAAFAVAAALLVAPAAFAGGGLLRRVLRAQPLPWIGLVSYGIFLWHFALGTWIAGYRFPGDNGPGLGLLHHLSHLRTLVLYVLTLALSCAVAAVSYYGVELRFLRHKERPLRPPLGPERTPLPSPETSSRSG